MKNDKITKIESNSDNVSTIISIQDCLKLIGLKELAANIYTFPKTIKPNQANLA